MNAFLPPFSSRLERLAESVASPCAATSFGTYTYLLDAVVYLVQLEKLFDLVVLEKCVIVSRFLFFLKLWLDQYFRFKFFSHDVFALTVWPCLFFSSFYPISVQGFDALVASLDARGVREAHLQSMLQRIEISFKETVRRNLQLSSIGRQSGGAVKTEDSEMARPTGCSVDIDSPSSTVCVSNSDATEPSASFSIELGRNDAEKFDALNRYQDFEKWMWKECINPSTLCALKYGKKRCTQLLGICDHCHDLHFFEDNHCPSCHRTYSPLDSNYSEHVAQCEEKHKVDLEWGFSSSSYSSPLRIKLLKAHLALIEVGTFKFFA